MTTILLTVRIVIRMLRRRWATTLVTMWTALVAMRTMSVVTMVMGGLIMMRWMIGVVPAPAAGAPWPPVAPFP